MSDTPTPPPAGKPRRETCTAKSKRTGKRCGQWPPEGALVCRWHGGATPNARKHAARVRAEAQLAEMAETTYFKLNKMSVGNPLEELQKLASEVIAWKNILRRQVTQLQNKFRYSTETEQIRGEVVLFERALDRCASVLGLIAKLNIDDRLAAIEEAKVTKIIDAVNAALDKIGLPVEDQLKARGEIARHLRAVS